MYCMILQPLSRACKAVLQDTGMCTELCLLRNIDLFISQLVPAGFSHISLQALNQSDMRLWHPFPPPIRSLLTCSVSLAGSVLQSMRSSGLRQPRRPAAGEWVLGWSACSWGRLSSQGLAWFMWEMLLGPVLKAAGGVERRDVEWLLLWDCCDVVGVVRECYLSIDLFIVLHSVLRVRCSYIAAFFWCENVWLVWSCMIQRWIRLMAK